jgi:hypothetical protein
MTFRSILLLILFGVIVITSIGKLRQGVAEANLRVETVICHVLAVEAQLGAIRRTTCAELGIYAARPGIELQREATIVVGAADGLRRSSARPVNVSGAPQADASVRTVWVR